MNINRCCDEPCYVDGDDTIVSTATPEGIELARKAIERLGHPNRVTYADLADAFTPKMENGEPCHEDGHHEYLKFGTDLTCDCVLQFVLQQCGYADDGTPGPVQAAKLKFGDQYTEVFGPLLDHGE
jgi:hypothetical protein